jgi:hypothetical protein
VTFVPLWFSISKVKNQGVTPMKLTIEVPDSLGKRLNDYLKEHPEETLFSLVQEALEIKLIPKDISKLLELAGIVTVAPRGAAEHAEDYET